MENGKWFAILVIVLFMLSMFSVILYSNNTDDVTETTTLQDPTENLPIQYSANLIGKVVEIPAVDSYRLIGYTNESVINDIDLSIRDLDNVYNVTSTIVFNNDTNAVNKSYIYMADVQGQDINYDVFYSSVQDNNFLVNSVIYPYAKIDSNSFVEFVNKDLNLTKAYDLGSNEYIVLVEPNTLLDDVIEFTLQAKFSGDSFAGYGAYMVNNVSASPKLINSIYNGEFTLDFYDISFDANIPESDFNYLKEMNLDFNYYSYDSTDLIINKESNLSEYFNSLKKIEEDYNILPNVFVYGNVYVDSIQYLDMNYEYNNLVNAVMDYNKYEPNKNYDFTLSAYLVRDEIVSANAQYIN